MTRTSPHPSRITHRRIAGLALLGALVLPASAPAADERPPQPPKNMYVVGGEQWRRDNGFTVRWQLRRDEGTPIHKAHWQMCRIDKRQRCQEGVRRKRNVNSLRLRVFGTGAYTLRVRLEDEAGNQSNRHWSRFVNLRYDPKAPLIQPFAPPDAAHPRILSVSAADRHSGVAYGAIEMRRSGSQWFGLPTRHEGDRFSAEIPDMELADGAYEVRARVGDVAGNEALGYSAAGGGNKVVVLPVRERTRLVASATALRTVRTCRSVLVRVGRRLLRRLVCRDALVRTTVSLPDPLFVPFGGEGVVSGTLQTTSGRPVAGAPVSVAARPRSDFELAPGGYVVTDGQGSFSYRIVPGPSQALRFAFSGDEVTLPSELDGGTLVPGATTVIASRSVVRNGWPVVFSGRVLGGFIPAGGRTVTLQAFYRGLWRTFAAPRTNALGGWRHYYRFGATFRRTVYRFRAIVHREAGHPFETGYSRVVTVTVLGR